MLPSDFLIRRLNHDDEAAFLKAHSAMADDGRVLGLGYEDRMPWPQYLQLRANQEAGVNVPETSVANTFLVAVAAGEIVGRISVRHCLNDFLQKEGGHIGYCTVPAWRRKGVATRLLKTGLQVAADHQIETVLMTCDEVNTPSIRTIEKYGGRLLKTIPAKSESIMLRHYAVPTEG
ncbi:MAG: hypothetical protein Fues2KO_15480 [Fuerstiella sp.]